MPKQGKQKAWKRTKGWRNHGFACWDSEWEAYRSAATLVGAKSVNGWIRSWLNEAVRYERMNKLEGERVDRVAGESEDSGSS